MKNHFYILLLLLLLGCQKTSNKVVSQNFEEYLIINDVLSQVIDTTTLYYNQTNSIKFYPPGTKEYENNIQQNINLKQVESFSTKEYFQKYYERIDKPIILKCEAKTDIYFHNYLDKYLNELSDPEEIHLFNRFEKLTHKTKEIDVSKLFYSSKVKIIKYGEADIGNKDYCYKGSLRFSDIVLNDNRDKAIFYLGFVCGPECGYGNIFVLEKKNIKWKVIKAYGLWVS